MPKPTQIEHIDIPGFPGYKINELGEVISCWNRGSRHTNRKMTSTWKVLKTCGKGYPRVNLYSSEGKRAVMGIHILVLITFVGPCPDNYEARHLDDNKKNSVLSNLVWGTRKDNMEDRVRNNIHLHGERIKTAKLSYEKINEARVLYTNGISQRKIAKFMEVAQSQISRALSGERWKYAKANV